MAEETLSDKELDEIYAFAIQLGKDAGKLLLQATNLRINNTQQAQSFSEKDNSVDIVTKTDEDVESFIKTSIQARYPSHAFIGEETYSKTSPSSRPYLISSSSSSCQPTWLVDPLDGTVNFTHLSPFFCVSIAFLVKNNEPPIIGVIYAPVLNQLFTSCRGRGSWMNETQRLPLLVKQPMPRNAPGGCIFACEWGKDRRRDKKDGNLQRKVDSFFNMAAEAGGGGGMVHGVRSLGSATLDLAYTAMGAFDIWWEGGCWEWDVAAGIAILTEAGGLVTTANPPPDPKTAEIPPVRLGSRLYLAIRPAGPSECGETGRQGQERTVREVWKRVRALDYSRPGA
ncbi:protein qutG [Cladorrhinum sp. PSN332]|nr:protein qutG [Cladorrhinum sp. PSN332]